GKEGLGKLLGHEKPNVRRAALLGGLETRSLSDSQVMEMSLDTDPTVAEVANFYLKKTGKKAGTVLALQPAGGDYHDPITVRATGGTKSTVIRYTTDGSMPTHQSPIFDKPIRLEKQDAVIMASLFRGKKRVGPILPARYHWLSDEEWKKRLAVTKLSQDRYRVVERGLKNGAKVYIDREYKFKNVPAVLAGATQIRTANDHKNTKGDKHLAFRISSAATVYVGIDKRGRQPGWLKDAGFKDVGQTVETDDTTFRLYEKRYPAGPVTLGGNKQSGSSVSMYMVALKQVGADPVDRPGTKLAQVLPLLVKADAKAGEKLFFGKGGCFACHKVGDKGNALGPELSDLGLRAEAKFVAESILDPNAFIIEGYLQGFVKTKDGKEYFGMLRDESALVVTVFQANGQAVSIKKSNVAEKKLLDKSAMPAIYSQLFKPKEVADLVRYLMDQKKKLQ
ncbi:MAG: chitobiase/beta-hexosaminidase C-terminal domain-containing protein, partial [Phycisphaeraceae bacterium]|nr:chitobiase/beta-hexosaminidase C-terminal domain-containing protein [Phycisphaeraceae bacterium]